MKEETVKDLARRVEEGDLVKQFLGSPVWERVLSPMLESMVKGLIDVRGVDVSSDKKAAIEVRGKVWAADYIEGIKPLLDAYVTDGEVARKLLTPPQQRDSLIREH